MTSIRLATAADVPLILEFIRALASYEREPEAVRATHLDLLRDGFGEHPYFECLIAESLGGEGGVRPVGFALYFVSYSTWRGRAGIHVEDLFVPPEFRGKGVGRALLKRVAERAAERGFDWLGWNVLEWNSSAIDFYRRLGAEVLAEWRIMRIAGEDLTALAAERAIDSAAPKI